MFSEGDGSDVGSQGVYSSVVSILGFGQEMLDFGVLLGRPRPTEKSLHSVSDLSAKASARHKQLPRGAGNSLINNIATPPCHFPCFDLFF